jgi:hypothetical protein
VTFRIDPPAVRVPGVVREHLKAVVENDDPAESHVLAKAPFSDAQRRYVNEVLRRLGAAATRA